MSEFFQMGGYAFYVWSSYAVFFVAIAIDFFSLKRQDKLVKRNIKSFLRRKKSD